MSSIWMNYYEIEQAAKGKKVILWGRSEDWTEKTLASIKNLKVSYIVDSEKSFNNTTFLGLNVYLPNKLKEENLEDIFIIITASAYESIELSMESFNLQRGLNYCCTPEYKDWALLQEIKNYDQDIIITCTDSFKKGDKRYSKLGGGIYILNTKSNNLKRMYQGHFRQILKVAKYYYCVEYVEKKLYKFDLDFNYIANYDIDQTEKRDQKPHYCGLAYHKKLDCFYIANSGNDTITILDRESMRTLETIYVSEKTKSIGGGLHHINDLTIIDNSLYVSCFSISGAWKKDILDGGIFEFNVNNIFNPPQVLMNNLWKPHSVEFYNNKISFLDSMRGDFYIGNQKKAGRFDGFMKGIAYDNRFYFIGQCESLYTTELFGIKDQIMLNSGVYLYDPKTRVSRFYSLPDLSVIHDVKIYEAE